MDGTAPVLLDNDDANTRGGCKDKQTGLKGEAASERPSVSTMVPVSSLPDSGSGGGSSVGLPAPFDNQEHRIVLYRPRHRLPSISSGPSVAGSLGCDSEVVPKVPNNNQDTSGQNVRKPKHPTTTPQLFHVNCALPGCDKTVMRQPSKCFGSNSLEIVIALILMCIVCVPLCIAFSNL